MCFILRFFLFFFSFVICIIVHSTCFVLLDKAANLYSLFCSNFSRLIFRIFFFFVSRKLFTSDSSHIVLPLDNIPCLGYPCVLCCRISTSKGLFRPFYVSFFYLFIVFILLLLFFVENFGRLASWFPDYQGRLITRGRLAAAFSLMLGALSNLSSDEWGKRFVINKAEAGCMLFCDMVMPLLCMFSCLFLCVSVSL